MPPRPSPAIAAIQPYKGGESTLPGFDKPVKLASNENPLGASPAAKAAFQAAAERLHLYPDGAAAALRAELAQAHAIEADRIVAGAGSDEIFQLLARAFLSPGDEIVQSEYAFLVYRLVAQQSGAAVRSAKDTDYRVDVDAMLSLCSEKTKIVFLANPNNPTGTWVTDQEVRRLQAGLPADALLVLDGAYAEFVDDPAYGDGLALARDSDNVLVTRTFSKIYGLAALRLGWAYGPPVVIDALNKTRGPFNVAGPALAAGLAALKDQDFVAQSRTHNARERARAADALAAMGLRATPSAGNFILIHFEDAPGRRAADADAFLRARGFILRRLEAYGLPNALRLSIGTEAQNAAVLEALARFAAPA